MADQHTVGEQRAGAPLTPGAVEAMALEARATAYLAVQQGLEDRLQLPVS